MWLSLEAVQGPPSLALQLSLSYPIYLSPRSVHHSDNLTPALSLLLEIEPCPMEVSAKALANLSRTEDDCHGNTFMVAPQKSEVTWHPGPPEPSEPSPNPKNSAPNKGEGTASS